MNRLKLVALLLAAFGLFGCKVGNNQPKQEQPQQQSQAEPTKEERNPQQETKSAPGVKGPDYDLRAAFYWKLRDKYDGQIEYDSSSVGMTMLGTLHDYKIPCQHNDGRVITPYRILLLQLDFAKRNYGNQDTFFIKTKGEETRIYQEVRNRQGKVVHPSKLAYLFNGWGDMRIINGPHKEAILNACYGGFGPIWTYPDEGTVPERPSKSFEAYQQAFRTKQEKERELKEQQNAVTSNNDSLYQEAKENMRRAQIRYSAAWQSVPQNIRPGLQQSISALPRQVDQKCKDYSKGISPDVVRKTAYLKCNYTHLDRLNDGIEQFAKAYRKNSNINFQDYVNPQEIPNISNYD